MIAKALLFATSIASTPSGFDYDAWEAVLARHVQRGAQLGVPINVVDYEGIKRDPEYHRALESLAKADLSNLSMNESFALGCNAYNVFSVKTLIDNACQYDVNGKCLGPVWGLTGIKNGFSLPTNIFGRKNYTLNDVEAMLRPLPSAPLFSKSVLPIKEDLRVHSCMVCDGTSCPDLHFFSPFTIDEDLSGSARAWMANPYKGMRIDRSTGHPKRGNMTTVYFSRIMSWFKDEFVAQGGVEVAYAPYFTKEARDFFLSENTGYATDYFDYIWDANGPVPCDCLPESDTPGLLLPKQVVHESVKA